MIKRGIVFALKVAVAHAFMRRAYRVGFYNGRLAGIRRGWQLAREP